MHKTQGTRCTGDIEIRALYRTQWQQYGKSHNARTKPTACSSSLHSLSVNANTTAYDRQRMTSITLIARQHTPLGWISMISMIFSTSSRVLTPSDASAGKYIDDVFPKATIFVVFIPLILQKIGSKIQNSCHGVYRTLSYTVHFLASGRRERLSTVPFLNFCTYFFTLLEGRGRGRC